MPLQSGKCLNVSMATFVYMTVYNTPLGGDRWQCMD